MNVELSHQVDLLVVGGFGADVHDIRGVFDTAALGEESEEFLLAFGQGRQPGLGRGLEAEAVSFDGEAGEDLFGVSSPTDMPMLRIYPLAPVELGQLSAEPSFSIGFAVEALRVLPSIGSSVAGTPRCRSVGPVVDRSSHEIWRGGCRSGRTVRPGDDVGPGTGFEYSS